MQYDNVIQKKIDEAVKQKQIRFTQQSLSILVCWSVNCAVDTLGEVTDGNWDWAKREIKERYPFFIELYKEWMEENMTSQVAPEVPKPPTPKQAQTLQQEADRIKAEAETDDEKAKRWEAEQLPIVEG